MPCRYSSAVPRAWRSRCPQPAIRRAKRLHRHDERQQRKEMREVGRALVRARRGPGRACVRHSIEHQDIGAGSGRASARTACAHRAGRRPEPSGVRQPQSAIGNPTAPSPAAGAPMTGWTDRAGRRSAHPDTDPPRAAAPASRRRRRPGHRAAESREEGSRPRRDCAGRARVEHGSPLVIGARRSAGPRHPLRGGPPARASSPPSRSTAAGDRAAGV